MGSAIGEFRCCPHMLCQQICDLAAWTWMPFSLCVPSPVATVQPVQVCQHTCLKNRRVAVKHKISFVICLTPSELWKKPVHHYREQNFCQALSVSKTFGHCARLVSAQQSAHPNRSPSVSSDACVAYTVWSRGFWPGESPGFRIVLCCFFTHRSRDGDVCVWVSFFTKGSLGYLSSMYFSTSLVLGEVAAPFP